MWAEVQGLKDRKRLLWFQGLYLGFQPRYPTVPGMGWGLFGQVQSFEKSKPNLRHGGKASPS